MNLRAKLFLSHFAVVLISLILLAILTLIVAPAAFESNTDVTLSETPQDNEILIAEVDENETSTTELTSAVLTALLVGGGVAIVVAAAFSWYISRRIVRPLQEVAVASQYIADGHYDHRLKIDSADEVGELALHFNEMARALADIEQTRRQLIADVSHELKTPLASIKGYMEGLQDSIIPATAETYHMIYREADRLERLVRDLNELSYAEAGTPSLQPRPCSTADLVQFAATQLTPQFQSKSVQLCIDCPPEISPVCADPDRSRQILINLFGNALQYTPSEGKVTVTVQPHPDEKMIQFSVKDTGIGLDQAELKQIFQRFYRVDKSRARTSGGSGIGLTIARHWVEAHGGQIWAESEGLRQGSSFHFTLPRVTV